MLPDGERLSIIIVASEISPFSKTGGLADVADKLGLVAEMLNLIVTCHVSCSRNAQSWCHVSCCVTCHVVSRVMLCHVSDVADKLGVALARLGHRVMSVAPMYKVHVFPMCFCCVPNV